MISRLSIIFGAVLLHGSTLLAAEPGTAGIEMFERKVRPLLAENCYSCHGEEKQKGKLRLDSTTAIRAGGESGPIFVPGRPEESRLIRAVRYTDEELKMPPRKRLIERQITVLTEWVQLGAPMPSEVASTSITRTNSEGGAPDRPHWAFQPLQKLSVPPGSTAIDGFIQAALREKGLAQNPPASDRELVRRAYFDLIGLPPSPETVRAYETDPSPDRYEKLIDRLLASPQYGERWGRHWLDLVRFAQSNGYERDGEKLLAWRYRDYVIKAFNEDKPYDRFIMEQIAGDELCDATSDSVVATAFQRLGVFDDEPDDKRMAEFDALDDILSTTGTTFLGLTLGCARCHDHKFDPIPQKDYYSLLAFFRGIRPFESTPPSIDSPGFAPLVAPAQGYRWRAEINRKLAALQEELNKNSDPQEKKRIEAEIKKTKEAAPYPWTLAVRESGPTPPPTFILTRGNPATLGAEVFPAFPEALTSDQPNLPQCASDAASSGRRLALAQWVASPKNPLTGRVIVNRIWQHHFGEGLVKTTSDFGRAGVSPSHPALLDWLANEFIRNGWSIKKMHRGIMLSATYRQTSRSNNEQALAVDPGNRLLWRQNLRRLEAESLRDTILTIAGNLNPEMNGRGFFPHLSGEVLAGQSRPGLDWDVSSQADLSRRSVYAFVRRTMGVPLLETFDYNNTTSPVAERPTTTVAPQALILLNDPFMHQQARSFAKRLWNESGTDTKQQIQRAYALALNRSPSAREMEIANSFGCENRSSFSQISSQMTFQPDVADALSTDYFEKLAPRQFLLGPQQGWNYYGGGWAPAYEGIRVLYRDQAPFALKAGTKQQDVTIRATLSLSTSCEFAGVLFRAEAPGEKVRGYELLLDAREHRLSLRRHGDQSRTIAEVSTKIPVAKPLEFKLESVGSHTRVWIDSSTPVLDAADPDPIASAGSVGIRPWGGSVTIEKLSVSDIPPDVGNSNLVPEEANRRALEAFCLLLLNLNEVVYVD